MTTAPKSKGKPQPPPRPEPGEQEKAAIAAAEARQAQRARPVETDYEQGGSGPTLCSPHADASGWTSRLLDGFGTDSVAFATAQLNVLDRAGRDRGEAQGKSAQGMNTGLALVAAIRPENELEAALAVQMAGVHGLASDMLGRAKQTDRTDHIALYGGLAVKLTRTFAAQVEALAKLRGGGKQQVEVRHVYVDARGSRTIIGDINGGRGATENERQPHAPGLAFAPGEAVWSKVEAEREAVPSPGGEEEGAVPDARRR